MNCAVNAIAYLDTEIERNVSAALAEDVGSGDLTAQLVPAGTIGRAKIISREHAVLCGTAWFERCFLKLDSSIRITWKAADGERVVPDQVLCELEGPARALLTGERTALNFLQMLSGVATKTRQYADLVAGLGQKLSIHARPCPDCASHRSLPSNVAAAATTASASMTQS